MLRIHHPRGLRRETEELGVEFVDPIQEWRALDIQRIAKVFSLTPAAPSCSSDNVTIDSSPRCRLCQNADSELAPGNLPAMPTTAMALAGSVSDARNCSRVQSSLPPHCGTVARSRALVGSVANAVDARSAGVHGHAELPRHVGHDVIQRPASQQQRY